MSNRPIVLYHYTELDKWMRREGSNQGLEPRSLQSLHKEVRDPRAYDKATFVLLHPTPIEWTNNPSFPTLWDEFVHTRGDLLIEVNADMDDKNILVGDAGFIEGYLYKNNAGLYIPHEYRIEDPEQAFIKYQDSLIPIGEYLAKRKKYFVPEVQIRRLISRDELRVSPQQPLLERELGNKPLRDDFIYPVTSLYKYQRELQDWFQRFEEKNPWLRDSMARVKSSYEGSITGEK
jgi:hypothetical protein